MRGHKTTWTPCASPESKTPSVSHVGRMAVITASASISGAGQRPFNCGPPLLIWSLHMAETTAIEWCDRTWSPWTGCTKLAHPKGSACDHCYAAAWAKRTGHPELWEGERRRTSAVYWQKPFKWDRLALASGERPRIFPSLCDPFDNQVPPRWRDDMWFRIDQTPHLDWLLLTKRPQNIAKMLPDPRTGVKPWGGGWPNVWLGTTAEDQDRYDQRWPHLAKIPAPD